MKYRSTQKKKKIEPSQTVIPLILSENPETL